MYLPPTCGRPGVARPLVVCVRARARAGPSPGRWPRLQSGGAAAAPAAGAGLGPAGGRTPEPGAPAYPGPGEIKVGMTSEEVADAWIGKLQFPKPSLPSNARFYFTEIGWDEIGREVIAACQRSGQKYRVIAIKENAIDVAFQDEYQVAGQPIRHARKDGRRRRPNQG